MKAPRFTIKPPTAVALAANDHAFAVETARQLHTRRLRIYANDDLIGVEVGGAVPGQGRLELAVRGAGLRHADRAGVGGPQVAEVAPGAGEAVGQGVGGEVVAAGRIGKTM